MPRYLIAALILVGVIGCSAQATPTPTSVPPPPTETAVPPTETLVPPTATLVPTQVPPTATATQVPITGTAKATLNVREAPSLTAKLLGTLNKGDTFNLNAWSQDKKWLQINYPLDSTTNGWVISSLVETTASTEALATVTVQVASDTPTTAGTKVAVAATVPVSATEKPPATATLQPAVASGAPSGSIIFDTFEKGAFQINQVRADGTALNVLFTGASEPALAPAGTTLAYHKRNGVGAAGLWTSNLDGSNAKQIVNTADAGYPTWSSDGNNLAYHLSPNGKLSPEVWRVTREGSDATRIGLGVRPAWQPGGSSIVVFDGCDGNGANCSSLHTENAFTPDVSNPKLLASGTNAAWSPNGSQVAFQETDASGVNIYVASQDGSIRRAVTKDSGQSGDPIWSSNGQWIFYRSDKSGVWALYAIRVDGTGDRKIVDAPVNGDIWNFEKLAIAP